LKKRVKLRIAEGTAGGKRDRDEKRGGFAKKQVEKTIRKWGHAKRGANRTKKGSECMKMTRKPYQGQTRGKRERKGT